MVIECSSFLKPVSSATSAAVDMDGPEIAIVTKGLKKFCPFTGICAKFWTAYPKKWKLLAAFHQFCHSLQRTNAGSAISKTFMFTN
jgi:hypothetical protein